MLWADLRTCERSVRPAPLGKVRVHLMHLALKSVQLGFGDAATHQEVDEILNGGRSSVRGQDSDARQRSVVHGA